MKCIYVVTNHISYTKIKLCSLQRTAIEPTPLGIKYPPMIKSFWVTLPFPGNTGYNLETNIYEKFNSNN